MTIVQAVIEILGAPMASSMLGDESLGLRWAVIAAMAEATTDHDPLAIEAIRAWNADERRKLGEQE